MQGVKNYFLIRCFDAKGLAIDLFAMANTYDGSGYDEYPDLS
jgi:hypothetical protein